MLNKEAILAVDDLRYEDVDVPEWGGSVRVRVLTGRERDEYEQSLFKGNKQTLDNMRAKLVALSLVDENGERLFTMREAEDLGKKNSAVIARLFSVAQRLSGIGQEAELEKNSEATPDGDSVSG